MTLVARMRRVSLIVVVSRHVRGSVAESNLDRSGQGDGGLRDAFMPRVERLTWLRRTGEANHAQLSVHTAAALEESDAGRVIPKSAETEATREV